MHRVKPSISTALFATNIGALDRKGISHVNRIITLESLGVIILLSGKQMPKNLSNAIASKLRMEQRSAMAMLTTKL